VGSSTPNYSFRYPYASDAADGPTQLLNLATDLDNRRYADRMCAAQLRATTATTLTTANVMYKIAFATEEFDTDNGHDNATNNTRWTCPRAGKYVLAGGFGCTPSGAGPWMFMLAWHVSPVGQIDGGSARYQVTSTNQVSFAAKTTITGLSVGQYVELGVMCDQASQTSSTSGPVQPTMTIYRLMD
jgi:hypothetical protein